MGGYRILGFSVSGLVGHFLCMSVTRFGLRKVQEQAVSFTSSIHIQSLGSFESPNN